MTSPYYDNEMQKLIAFLHSIEEKAGIDERMKRARDSHIPMGLSGVEETPDGYFADEHDYVRHGTRDCYFGVKDIELRKDLIRAARKVYAFRFEGQNAEIEALNQALTAARVKIESLSWLTTVATGAAIFIVGYQMATHLVGAIVGAVGGLFLGASVIQNVRNRLTRSVQEAKDQLELAKESKRSMNNRPAFFTLDEEYYGERDVDFDRESTLSNPCSYMRKHPAS